MKKFIALVMTTLMIGCGQGFVVQELSPIGKPDGEFVVRSRAVYLISTENGQTTAKLIFSMIIPSANAANPTSIPISVVNAPNASMTVNSSSLVAPALLDDNVSFGSITITNLSDNQLKVCGVGSNQKCGTALIRMYTSGTTGSGLYSTANGYGLPITAGRGATRTAVGLGSANSATVQTYTIPSNDNKVTETDFASPMSYNVDVDFSNAGSGTYTTTLVVEYGLSL